jgi:hypothetical protein
MDFASAKHTKNDGKSPRLADFWMVNSMVFHVSMVFLAVFFNIKTISMVIFDDKLINCKRLAEGNL